MWFLGVSGLHMRSHEISCYKPPPSTTPITSTCSCNAQSAAKMPSSTTIKYIQLFMSCEWGDVWHLTMIGHLHTHTHTWSSPTIELTHTHTYNMCVSDRNRYSGLHQNPCAPSSGIILSETFEIKELESSWSYQGSEGKQRRLHTCLMMNRRVARGSSLVASLSIGQERGFGR